MGLVVAYFDEGKEFWKLASDLVKGLNLTLKSLSLLTSNVCEGPIWYCLLAGVGGGL